MSHLEVFGVLTGVGVDVSKFFGVRTGVLKRGAGGESEKCDSAHLWWERRSHTFFWCGKAFPYLFALVTVLEDVRSKRSH